MPMDRGWWLCEAAGYDGRPRRRAVREGGERAVAETVPRDAKQWTDNRTKVLDWMSFADRPALTDVARQDMAVLICEGCACGWQRVYLHTKCAFVHLHDGQESPCNSPAFGVVPQE